jgi:hypothetical protein
MLVAILLIWKHYISIAPNVLQIGGRFNAANVLLYAAFITNLKTII